MSTPPRNQPITDTESVLHALWVAEQSVSASAPQGLGGASPEEVSSILESLVASVSKLVRGKPCTVDPRCLSDAGRQALERLRVDVAHRWAEADILPNAGAVVALWQAFEEVREALESGLPGELASRLSAQDGLHLLGEMAHDIRSPLTSIVTLTEVLQASSTRRLCG
jgi:signal transduction histidine kinase